MRFVVARFDTPHAILDMREVEGDLHWRVKAELLEIERRPQTRPAAQRMDYEGALCAACGERKPRKGGRNRAHRFVCADCK